MTIIILINLILYLIRIIFKPILIEVSDKRLAIQYNLSEMINFAQALIN